MAQFREYLKLDDGWGVYAFEPNPSCHGYFPRFCRENWHFSPFAVWTKNSWEHLRQEDWSKSRSDSPVRLKSITVDGQHSTIMRDSRRPGLLSPISVPALDFAEHLKHYAGYEKVVVKMSISGAEYPVLRHLLETRTLSLITDLYLDTNEQWMPRESRISTESLILACEEKTRVHRIAQPNE